MLDLSVITQGQPYSFGPTISLRLIKFPTRHTSITWEETIIKYYHDQQKEHEYSRIQQTTPVPQPTLQLRIIDYNHVISLQ